MTQNDKNKVLEFDAVVFTHINDISFRDSLEWYIEKWSQMIKNEDIKGVLREN